MAVGGAHSLSVWALVHRESPFLGFCFCQEHESPDDLESGEYTIVESRDVSVHLDAEDVQTVALTYDEARRIRRVFGSSREVVSTGIFDELAGTPGPPGDAPLGPTTRILVVSSFPAGDDELFMQSWNEFLIGEWEELHEQIRLYLLSGTIQLEMSEFQGLPFRIETIEQLDSMVEAYPIDAATQAAIEKLFPKSTWSFDLLGSVKSLIEA